MQVIVNADDLGISEGVNAEIFRLIGAGRVTSATLMANGPAVEQAAAQVRHFPGASFGVHLNINEFAPLTGARGLAPLLDANGRFAGNIRSTRITSGMTQAIRAEWNAQIDRIRALGVDVSHIDSHFHVHTVRELFGTLKAVQLDRGIHRVRLTKNLFTPAERPGGLRLAQKALWNAGLRHYVRTRTTAAFTDLLTMQSAVSADVPPATSVEVMVHPGHHGFVTESAMLEEEWWRRFRYGVEFVNYRQI
jgi:predicted glycoside hydrolase/deacetylase ChbG (UPF0249 family)